MAFNPIANILIQVGKPIIKTLWDFVQGNFDDHETRVSNLEQGASKVVVFNELVTLRQTALGLTNLDDYRAGANFTLLEAKVGIYTKGIASGTLEFDILKSPDKDRTNGVSVFTTKPSLVMAASNSFDDSINAVFDINEQDVLNGEYLILDITSLPTNLTALKVFLQGEFN